MRRPTPPGTGIRREQPASQNDVEIVAAHARRRRVCHRRAAGRPGRTEALGTQNFSALAQWTQRAAEIARRLGDRLEAGPLSHVAGQNLERQVLMLVRGERAFLIGWPAESAENLPEKSRKLVASWDS